MTWLLCGPAPTRLPASYAVHTDPNIFRGEYSAALAALAARQAQPDRAKERPHDAD